MTERLDRIEATLEAIAQSQRELIDGLKETRAIANSNAKAIQALNDTVNSNIKKAERDRARLYEAMARMSAAQSHFWQIQEDYYLRLGEVDKRQSRTVELLDRISQRLDEHDSNR
jgi:hypothetical protein